MSRVMTIATLGVLILLLALLKYKVNKASDPPPPPDAATMQAMQAQAASKDRDRQVGQNKLRQMMINKQHNSQKHPPMAAPAHMPDISDNWFTHGSDGQTGIVKARDNSVSPAGPSATASSVPEGGFGGLPRIVQPNVPRVK